MSQKIQPRWLSSVEEPERRGGAATAVDAAAEREIKKYEKAMVTSRVLFCITS